MFYHSAIHGLFISFMIKMLHAHNNKTRFSYVLYSDKRWVFDQSEHAHGPIYIIKSDINHKRSFTVSPRLDDRTHRVK